MKIPDKHGDRLQTPNYRTVTSEAVKSVDYDDRRKIIEIEYITGETYHYLDMGKRVWNKILKLVPLEKGLGGYVNSIFKKKFDTSKHKFYKLIPPKESKPKRSWKQEV